MHMVQSSVATKHFYGLLSLKTVIPAYLDQVQQMSLVTAAKITLFYAVITFHVRHSRGKMYSGHARLCVYMSVCPSSHSHTTAQTRM